MKKLLDKPKVILLSICPILLIIVLLDLTFISSSNRLSNNSIVILMILVLFANFAVARVFNKISKVMRYRIFAYINFFLGLLFYIFILLIIPFSKFTIQIHSIEFIIISLVVIILELINIYLILIYNNALRTLLNDLEVEKYHH